MQLFLFIGLIFSPLAALCAFFITYDEYSHHYPDKRKPLIYAFQTALMTFLVFLLLSLAVGFLLIRGFTKSQ